MLSSKRLLTFVLASLVAGCAVAPAIKVVPVTPPAPLIETCQEPAQAVKTTRDMVTYLLDLRDALRGCAAQVEAIQSWVKAQGQPGQN